MTVFCAVCAGNAIAGNRVVVDLPLPARTSTGFVASAIADAPAPSPVRSSDAAPTAPRESSVLPDAAASEAAARRAPTSIQFSLDAGQSLYEQFEKHGLDRGSLVLMVRQNPRLKKVLRRLRPGQKFQVSTFDGHVVQELLVQRPGPTDLLVSRDASDRYHVQEVSDRPFESLAALASGPSNVLGPVDNTSTGADAHGSTDPDIEPPAAADAVQADTESSAPDAEGLQAPHPTALHRVTVKSGDSLYQIFRRLDLSPRDLARLLAADKKAHHLKSLRPGQEIALGISHDKRLHSVNIELDEERTLSAKRSGTDDYEVAITHHPLERRIATASAVIENSLFLAGQRAGLSDRVIMELIEIFGWDVDFALDVRAGDRFTLIHEEFYKDGEKVRDGPILASEFFNRGRSVRAIRFVDDSGRSAYYSPEGLSMRKAFLRTPVRFSRISSRFSSGRMHPVLQRMRAHKGVDYAAPTGTPINATGDGRVVFAGNKGGYGRTVIIQHGSTYTTLYAHMSRLHRRARPGTRVRQGDTIGYVGSSGLATGPHLHYEFRVRGRHVDPLRVKLPKALPIERRYEAAFRRTSRPLVHQLDSLANTSLASSN